MEKYTVNGEPLETKDQAIQALCNTANFNCLPIHELWCYEGVCKQFNISPDDYYNDEASLTQEHLDYAGNNNWKPVNESK